MWLKVMKRHRKQVIYYADSGEKTRTILSVFAKAGNAGDQRAGGDHPPASKSVQTSGRRNEAPMKYKICGLEVNQEIYDEYAGRKYDVNGRKISGAYIEVHATSKEIADKLPEDAKAARVIYHQIRREIREKQEGNRMGYKDFGGYLEELKDIYAAGRITHGKLQDAWETEQAEYKAAQRKKLSEADTTIAKGRYLQAEKTFHDGITQLQEHVGQSIAAVRQRMGEHLDSFYLANPDKLDMATMELLRSGILTSRELERLAGQNTGNVTMLRVIGVHAEKMLSELPEHKTEDGKRLSALSHAVKSLGNGERELGAFDTLAMYASKGLQAERGLADGIDRSWERVCSEQMSKLSEAAVKPE